MPDQGKIIQIQSHSIVKQKRILAILDSGERTIEFISLQSIDKFLHIGAGDQSVNIQPGMSAKKLPIRRNIDGIRVAVIKQIGHDLLQHADLIASGIQIQKPALFWVGKLIYF